MSCPRMAVFHLPGLPRVLEVKISPKFMSWSKRLSSQHESTPLLIRTENMTTSETKFAIAKVKISNSFYKLIIFSISVLFISLHAHISFSFCASRHVTTVKFTLIFSALFTRSANPLWIFQGMKYFILNTF